ncbi:MAG TPA: hypothetical protein VEX43_01350 [Chthoniobacterales bacterium]|nr:hypothetical protein [Chthoniobacterales bacterium]
MHSWFVFFLIKDEAGNAIALCGSCERFAVSCSHLAAQAALWAIVGSWRSTPEIYQNEWASFTTKDFPENRSAKRGEPVRIVMKDVTDARLVIDIVWFHDDYLKLFAASELN